MYSMIPKPTNVSSILFEIQELEIDTDLAQICFPSHSGFRSYQRLGTAVFPMFVRKVSRRSKTGLKNIKPTAVCLIGETKNRFLGASFWKSFLDCIRSSDDQ